MTDDLDLALSANISTYFSRFVHLCEKILGTKSKNMKVNFLSEYLSSLNEESLSIAVLFLSNRIFSPGSKATVNMGYSTIMRTLSEISVLDQNKIRQIYLKFGDMGALSEYAVSKKHTISLLQPHALTLLSVHNQFRKIADTIGYKSNKNKRNILKGLYLNSSPLEAKYLTKMINGEMRIGLTEGLVQVAVSRAFNQELRYVREAMLVLGNISQVTVLAKKSLLHTALIRPLNPVSYMLADVMFTAKEIINYYQKPLICEYKYDGIRAQMHKSGQQVRFFSRNLTDVTKAFPELANAAININLPSTSSLSDINLILDGEVIGFLHGKPLHFQLLQKRLRKKNITEQIMNEVPLAYVVYDILYLNGEATIRKPLKARKEILSKISFREPINNSYQCIVNSKQRIIAVFKESRDMGHEGLILKDPDSLYYPGRRGRYWIKLKKELDTVDAIIVSAEYGHGKRAGTLSDYTFAVKDDYDDNQLRIIGKAYSGLTDEEINNITGKLRTSMIKDEGYRIVVRPEIVLEIAFDSIQRSDRHNSGFALRFPRIKNIRKDKTVWDIDSLSKIKQIYNRQVYLMNENKV
jgi:DNA ligase-1